MTQTSTESVKDVADFITRLKDLQLSDGQRRFFRGHSKHSHHLTPNVYRDAALKENESALYHDCLRLVPEAFIEDSNTIERLVRMQHEELPTRLLDVSESPLVALFFCVRYANDKSKATEEDGEVIIFDWPENELYHSATLPEVSLAGIEHRVHWENLIHEHILKAYDFIIRENYTLEFENILKKQNASSEDIKAMVNIFTDFHKALSSVEPKDKKQVMLDIIQLLNAWFLLEFKLNKCFNYFLEKNINDNNEFELIKTLRNKFRLGIQEIYDEVRNTLIPNLELKNHKNKTTYDNISFCFSKDILGNHLYLPPLNNPRIKAQQGAFIVCLPVTHELGDLQAQIDHETLAKFNSNINIHRIRISHQHKAAILEELANLGISEATMFPDLRTQIKSLEHRYKAKQ